MLPGTLNLRAAGSRIDNEQISPETLINHRRTASMPVGYSVSSKSTIKSGKTTRIGEIKLRADSNLYQQINTPTHRDKQSNSDQILAASAEGKLLRNSRTRVSKFERSYSGCILEGSTTSLGISGNNFGGSFLNNLDKLINQLQSQNINPENPIKDTKKADLSQFALKSKVQQIERRLPKSKPKRGQGNTLNALKQSILSHEPLTDSVLQKTQRTRVAVPALTDSETSHQRETVKTSSMSGFGVRRSSLATTKMQTGTANTFVENVHKSATGPNSYNSSRVEIPVLGSTSRLSGQRNSLPQFLHENYASSLSQSRLMRRSTATQAEAPGYYLSKEQFDMLTERCSIAIQKYQECEQKIERLEKEYSKLKSRKLSHGNLDRRFSKERASPALVFPVAAEDTQQQVTTSSSSGWWPGSNNASKSRKQSKAAPRYPLGDSADTPEMNPESSNDRNDTLPMALAPRKKVFDFLAPNPGVCFNGLAEKPLKRAAGSHSSKVTLQTVKDRLRDKLNRPGA